MYNSTNSNYTEEAFLLSSLQEVVKVWARGIGQAKFDLNICDGVADLSLNFKLGHPSEPHCEPVHLHPHHSHPHHHQQEYGQETPHPNPHRKSRSQRERNRLRAAKHRAATAATAVILPFTGNLLPVNKRNTLSPLTPKDVPHKEVVVSAAPPPRTVASASPPPRTAATAAPPAATAGSPAPPFAGPPTAARPSKAPQASQAAANVKFVKKQLFQAPLQHQPSPNPTTGQKKHYQMQEDDLWTKLFT